MQTEATKPIIWRKADCKFWHQDSKKRFILEVEKRNEFGIYISDEMPNSKTDLQVAYDWWFDSEYDYVEFCEAIYSLVKFCWWEVVPFSK